MIPTTRPVSDGSNTGISIIGRDLTIIGQGLRIISKGKIRVEGEIQGDVLGTEVIIGDVGKVTGVVSAETITVFGSIMGTIRGVRVLLEAGAKVEGDVHHQTLSVDEGAQLEGRVRRATDPAELRPDLSDGSRGFLISFRGRRRLRLYCRGPQRLRLLRPRSCLSGRTHTLRPSAAKIHSLSARHSVLL